MNNLLSGPTHTKRSASEQRLAESLDGAPWVSTVLERVEGLGRHHSRLPADAWFSRDDDAPMFEVEKKEREKKAWLRAENVSRARGESLDGAPAGGGEEECAVSKAAPSATPVARLTQAHSQMRGGWRIRCSCRSLFQHPLHRVPFTACTGHPIKPTPPFATESGLAGAEPRAQGLQARDLIHHARVQLGSQARYPLQRELLPPPRPPAREATQPVVQGRLRSRLVGLVAPRPPLARRGREVPPGGGGGGGGAL